MNFKTTCGKSMSIDLEKWVITSSTTCKIVGEDDNHYIIENAQEQTVKLSKSIISANHLDIVDNRVELSEAVYEHYFFNNMRAEANKRMDNIFNQHIDLIFTNRAVVLSKPEYYLLRPGYLTSGGAYSGGFSYSLGTLIESFYSGKHIFYEELSGHQKLYLISLSGSPLSGNFWASFWSDKDNKIVNLSSRKGHKLPIPFFALLTEFKNLVSGPEIIIDFQDKAIERLVDEISKLNQ